MDMLCPTCSAANRGTAQFCRVCGARDLILQGRYALLNEVGAGGMGEVYRAQDLTFTRTVAIKVLRLDTFGAPEQQEMASAFAQEARLLAGLMHPHLPRVHDHFQVGSRCYLVMDYIEGQTLEQHLATSGGKLPYRDAIQIGLALCEALEYLHTRTSPIIFRDLKPGNVMRSTSGHLYLIDFGIARLFKPGQSKDTQAWGSMGYAAPEQFGRTQTTAQSDLYSLGALLHQLITGEDPSDTPFQFSPVQEPRLQALLAQLTSHAAANRPASAAVLRQALQALLTTPLDGMQPVVVTTTGVVPFGAPATVTPTATLPPAGGQTEILLLYDKKDAALVADLETQLRRPIQRMQGCLFHNMDEILPGMERGSYQCLRTQSARLILVACSPAFYANDFLYGWMEGLVLPWMHGAGRGKTICIPIRAKKTIGVDDAERPWWGLLAIPRGKPISEYKDREEACYVVSKEILAALESERNA